MDCLPGQATAPAGPVDVVAMYVMHHAFRRDLGLFAAAATATPPDDRACWRRLARRWALFAGSLHKHHCGEDAGRGRCCSSASLPSRPACSPPWLPVGHPIITSPGGARYARIG
ncbi:hypothetical protein AB0K40_43345 [Nonomuraea bangladeshensis]|uniref:Hemerythrin domain-containing protein n=1 Tax=Nonomuraea bangladeshensis TaxID=404385 RepID=A0ABV3HIL1_9ACTN